MYLTGRKWVAAVLAVIVVLIVAAAGTAVWKYQRDLKNDAAIEQVGKVETVPAKCQLGAPVRLTAKFKCPWHRRPLEAVLTPAKGLREVGTPVIKRKKLGFGYGIWTVTATVKPYHTGKIAGSTLNVEFNRKGESNKIIDMELKVPGMNVTPIIVGNPQELSLASEIAPADLVKSHRNIIIAAIAILLVLIIVGIIIATRKRVIAEKVLSPWQVAILELTGLRDAISNHTMQPERCFSKLTDIVREYLEKRFSLRAPQQTTGEFLQDLNQSNSPLPDNHRKFLTDFMTAADLVKFANMPANGTLLGEAVDKAEALVSETKPAQEEEK